MYERLPTKAELGQLQEKIHNYRWLPAYIEDLLERIPKEAHPMDVLRTVCSHLGCLEPETKERDQFEVSIRLTSLFGPALIYWYHFSRSGKRIQTQTDKSDSIAKNFMKLFLNDGKEPPELLVKTFDVSLVLYAEHDFNASTFAARTTVSTLSDFYSAICTGIGTLRGPLHGGANEAAIRFQLLFKTKEEATK